MVIGLHQRTEHSENPSSVSGWNNFFTRLYLSHDKTPNYYRSFGNRKITKKENCTNISLLIFSYLSALNLDSFFTGVVCWSWENSLFIMYSLNLPMSSNGPMIWILVNLGPKQNNQIYETVRIITNLNWSISWPREKVRKNLHYHTLLSPEVSQILYALLNLPPSTCPSITPHNFFYYHSRSRTQPRHKYRDVDTDNNFRK
jgi:hypothetical protein